MDIAWKDGDAYVFRHVDAYMDCDDDDDDFISFHFIPDEKEGKNGWFNIFSNHIRAK